MNAGLAPPQLGVHRRGRICSTLRSSITPIAKDVAEVVEAVAVDHGISNDQANTLYAQALDSIEAFRRPGGYADALHGSNDPVDRLMEFLGRTSIRGCA